MDVRVDARCGAAAFVVCTLAAGCAPETTDSGFVVADSAGVTIVTNRTPEWSPEQGIVLAPEPDLVIGGGEGPGEGRLSQVRDAVRLPDGGVAVLNGRTAEVLLFDSRGVRVAAAGGRGGGPGEFAQPTWLALVGEELAVYDPQQAGGRLSRVGLTGRVLSVAPTNAGAAERASPVTALADGSLVATLDEGTTPVAEPGAVTTSTTAVRYLPGAAPRIDTVGSARGGALFRMAFGGATAQLPVPFGPIPRIAVAPTRLFMGNGERMAVEAFDLEGGRRMSMRAPERLRPVTPELVARWVEARFGDVAARGPPFDELLEQFRTTAPVPETMPEHAELEGDAAGRLWARRYEPPGEPGSSVWLVFDQRGRWLGEVAMPEGLVVHEIGRDYVLGLERDALDVERVVLYRLTSR